MTSYGIILGEKRFQFNPKLNSILIPAQVVFLSLFWLFVAQQITSFFKQLLFTWAYEIKVGVTLLLTSLLAAGRTAGRDEEEMCHAEMEEGDGFYFPPQVDLCITPQTKRVAVLQRLGAHGKCTKAGAGWWEATAGDDTDVCRSLPSGLYGTSVKLRL